MVLFSLAYQHTVLVIYKEVPKGEVLLFQLFDNVN